MEAINVNSTVFARLSETQLCQTKTSLKFEGRLLSIGKKKKKSSVVSDGWCSCNDKKNQVHQNRTRLNAVSSESYSIRSVSLYEVLGIEEDVGVDDIKQAYRQLVRKYHPDVCSQDDAEECKRRFIEIQEAYETLSDPNTRTIYDSRRAQGLGFSKFHYPSEEIAKEEWRSIWEVQLSMLKQKSRSEATEKPLSWGARMRQMKRSAQNN